VGEECDRQDLRSQEELRTSRGESEGVEENLRTSRWRVSEKLRRVPLGLEGPCQAKQSMSRREGRGDSNWERLKELGGKAGGRVSCAEGTLSVLRKR